MMNVVVLVGRLVKDPELLMVGENKDRPLCKFRIAVDRPGKDAGTDFINVACWNGLAETCSQYLSKGRLVGVTGRLQIDEFDGQDGSRKWAATVHATNVQFLSFGRKEDDAGDVDEPEEPEEEEPEEPEEAPAPARKQHAAPRTAPKAQGRASGGRRYSGGAPF